MGYAQQNPNYFGPAQSRLLARHLTHTQLPGLSSLDQMYLLALADTVANTKVDFAENQAADMAVKKGEEFGTRPCRKTSSQFPEKKRGTLLIQLTKYCAGCRSIVW